MSEAVWILTVLNKRVSRNFFDRNKEHCCAPTTASTRTDAVMFWA
jgi:hypothetical protein